MILKEACVGSYREALSATQKGADRLELCANLMEGGTTPSYGTINMAQKKLNIPILVIIRPRGGDFIYTNEEIEIMREDITLCKKLGVYGVVFGALTPKGELDEAALKTLIESAKPMQITFHMAFDELNDPEGAIENLIKWGVDRILTKGCRTCAFDGHEQLKQHVKLAAGRIIIVAGGGITDNNYKDLVAYTGIREVHGTKIVGKI